MQDKMENKLEPVDEAAESAPLLSSLEESETLPGRSLQREVHDLKKRLNALRRSLLHDTHRLDEEPASGGTTGDGATGEEATGDSRSTAPEGPAERRALSMDEILGEVERELEEEGPPVAERLTGAPRRTRHAAVLGGLPYEAFERVQEALGLSIGDLARVIGSSERTMRRRKESGRLTSSESDVLARIAVATEQAIGALGESRGVHWLTAPHPLLGGERALDFLSTSAGASVVEDMLGAIEHGMPV